MKMDVNRVSQQLLFDVFHKMQSRDKADQGPSDSEFNHTAFGSVKFCHDSKTASCQYSWANGNKEIDLKAWK